MEKFTPGPWAWFGSTRTDMYLATTHSGRRFVMGFKRRGLHRAEPTFQIKSVMVPASELAIYAVNPEATSATDPSVYRHDIIGFRSADATLIASAPELVDALKEARVALVYAERGSDAEDGAKYLATLSKIDAALSKAGVS